jgi:hypothetical protein
LFFFFFFFFFFFLFTSRRGVWHLPMSGATLAELGADDLALSRAEEAHPMILGVLTVRVHSASRLHAADPRLLAPHAATALAVRVETRTWTKRTRLAKLDPAQGSAGYVGMGMGMGVVGMVGMGPRGGPSNDGPAAFRIVKEKTKSQLCRLRCVKKKTEKKKKITKNGFQPPRVAPPPARGPVSRCTSRSPLCGGGGTPSTPCA